MRELAPATDDIVFDLQAAVRPPYDDHVRAGAIESWKKFVGPVKLDNGRVVLQPHCHVSVYELEQEKSMFRYDSELEHRSRSYEKPTVESEPESETETEIETEPATTTTPLLSEQPASAEPRSPSLSSNAPEDAHDQPSFITAFEAELQKLLSAEPAPRSSASSTFSSNSSSSSTIFSQSDDESFTPAEVLAHALRSIRTLADTLGRLPAQTPPAVSHHLNAALAHLRAQLAAAQDAADANAAREHVRALAEGIVHEARTVAEDVRAVAGDVRLGVGEGFGAVRSGVAEGARNVGEGFGVVREEISNVRRDVGLGLTVARDEVARAMGEVWSARDDVRRGIGAAFAAAAWAGLS